VSTLHSLQMLHLLLSRIIRQGTLTVIYPNGMKEIFGSGEPHVAMHLQDRWAILELFLDPDLKLGELYMDGRLTVEQGDVGDLLAMCNLLCRAQSPAGKNAAQAKRSPIAGSTGGTGAVSASLTRKGVRVSDRKGWVRAFRLGPLHRVRM